MHKMVKSLGSNLRTFWSVTGITLLLLVGIELMSSALLYLKRMGEETIDLRIRADSYEGTDWAEAYFREFNESNYFVWTPYVYWRRKPYSGNYINVSNVGIRRTWKPGLSEGIDRAQRIKIFMFGGSTMWGTGARDEYTISSFVSRILSKEYGYDVEIVNFGESGHVSTQGVISLIRELQKQSVPDVVVFYDGYNDVHSAFQSGQAGLPKNELKRRREFNLLNPRDSLWGRRLFKEVGLTVLQESGAYQLLNIVLNKVGLRATRATDSAASSKAGQELNQLAGDVVQAYAQNITLVEKLGRAYGFQPMFYWQPSIFRKNTLTPYERKGAKELEYLRPLYVNVNASVGARLGQVSMFKDISHVFDEKRKPYYIDYAHLSEAGNEVVARRMVADIAPLVKNIASKKSSKE